jgi:hypothetical protein
MERDKEQDGLAYRFSKERDKEQDGLCAHLQTIEMEKDAAGGSRQTLTTGSDFLLGNTWEQDQDACLPVYRPLKNKTERQTVSSTRRKQGPRALLTK